MSVKLSVFCVCSCQILTFADAGSVHHPDEGGAVLAVGGDTVLCGLEDVAVVFFYLQGAAEHSSVTASFVPKYTVNMFKVFDLSI